MAFFSIIIPLYNKETFIENTIQSILDQTFQDFEIIIVNDGSTDGSEEKILQFEDSRIYYFSKKNEGASTARLIFLKVKCPPTCECVAVVVAVNLLCKISNYYFIY